MQGKGNINKFWTALSVGCMLGLLVLSLLPYIEKEPRTWLQEVLHNLLHVPAYAVLTLFLIRLFDIHKVKDPQHKLVFATSFAYGALIEFLQGFIPGRTPSFLDLFLNAIGIFLAIYVFKKGFLNMKHNKADLA